MLNTATLRAAGCDVDAGLARCVNNEALYIRLVNMALDDSNFSRLTDAVASGDLKAGFEAAHADNRDHRAPPPSGAGRRLRRADRGHNRREGQAPRAERLRTTEYRSFGRDDLPPFGGSLPLACVRGRHDG